MKPGLQPWQQVSPERLRELMASRGEGDTWDFKRSLDLRNTKDRVELARDIMAMANTVGGGHIIIGVEDRTFRPVGASDDLALDTTDVFKQVARYTVADIRLACSVHRLNAIESAEERTFGIIYVEPSPKAVVASADGNYTGSDGRVISLFKAGDILVRRGAQTTRASQADINRLLGLSGSGQAGQLTSRQISSNLPNRQEMAIDFIGRDAELTQLWTWFNDEDMTKWVLAGDGGKGKTAIAYEFASQVVREAPKPFEYVLWLSAKKRRFLEGTVADIASDFEDYDSLLDAVLFGYGFTAESARTRQDKRNLELELFNDLPCLFAVDDIDSLEGTGDEALTFITDRLSRTNSKVLLTSRRVPDFFGQFSNANLRIKRR